MTHNRCDECPACLLLQGVAPTVNSLVTTDRLFFIVNHAQAMDSLLPQFDLHVVPVLRATLERIAGDASCLS